MGSGELSGNNRVTESSDFDVNRASIQMDHRALRRWIFVLFSETMAFETSRPMLFYTGLILAEIH